ncbi:phage portal protein [Rhizobium leguminosarum]|nr:phage portal protein [Rhizobium leguminosarum]
MAPRKSSSGKTVPASRGSSRPVVANDAGVQAQTRVVRQTTSARSADFERLSTFRASSSYHEAASHSPQVGRVRDIGPNGANGEIPRMQARSRWAYANDPFFRTAVDGFAKNVISYGIKPRLKDKALRKIWNTFVRESDIRGRFDLYGQQARTATCLGGDGEAFVQFVPVEPQTMKSGLNFKLKLIEADHVPVDKTEPSTDETVTISGVELDYNECPQAYWVYPFHPKDFMGTKGNNFLPVRVPASEILQIFLPDRPGAVRGKPMGGAALNTTENLRVYDIAEIRRKQGGAMYGGFYKRPANDDQGFTGNAKNGELVNFQALEPGMFLEVPEGWDVELSQPQQNDPNYPLFRREGLSALAVCFHLCVEQVSMQFDKLNDRTYRAVMLEVQRGIESIQYHVFVHQFLQPVLERVISAAYLLGLWAPEPGKRVEEYFSVEWIAPARGHINPVQEVAAFTAAVLGGFTSRKHVANSFGQDIEDIDEDNAIDQERSKLLGLSYSVYPALQKFMEYAIQQAMAEDAQQQRQVGIDENGGAVEVDDDEDDNTEGSVTGADEDITGKLNSYGVAVRAGVITPQIDDETAFRQKLGLPGMSSSVKGLWDQQQGYRLPVTLAGAGAAVGGDDPVSDPGGFAPSRAGGES